MAARILTLICRLLLLLLVSSVHNRWIALIPVLNVDAAFVNSSSDPAQTSRSCFAADLAALRSFAANFASPKLLTWKGDDCCSWEGVNCTSTTSSEPAAARRVSGIALISYDYSSYHDEGYFTGPEALLSLCSLSALSTLQLLSSHVFEINGDVATSVGAVISIPECVGTSLTNLETLLLSGFGEALTGSIPQSFSRLRSLRVLDLSFNDLSGPFRSFLCTDLPNLTTLRLSLNSFSGSIPSCDAPHLATLDLSSNSLSGNLSDFLSHSNLPNLTALDLSYNSFSGSMIPACDAPHLTALYLSGNSLSGNLSDFFSHSNLPNLTALDLSQNSLSGGDIPPLDPSRFSSLQELSLDSNQVTGNFLQSLCKLTTLQELSLASNALTGQIPTPSQCQALANLSSLDLSYNNFTSPFPSNWLGSLSNLRKLDLSYNNLRGTLPNEWHKLSFLTTLDLSGNSLMPHDPPDSPLLPLWLFQLPLTQLSLASMHLQPADLDCGSQLLLLNATIRQLDLSDNNLSASVLWCLSTPRNNFSSLFRLNMSRNPLSLTLNGADPIKLLLTQKPMGMLHLSSCELKGRLTHMFTDEGSTMPHVEELYLANNDLVGEIPPQLGNLSNLFLLDLSNNSFTRFSPFRDHKLPANPIRVLKLSNNNLTGDVSPMLLSLYNYSSLDELGQQCWLSGVDLSHNSLTGGITASLGQCHNLRRLKLNDNRLKGSIPNELFSNLWSLQTLSLSNNHLVGPILSSFGNNRELEFLDLSRNSFEGDLQTLFAVSCSNSNLVNLRVLLLGHNNFTGSIPHSLGNCTPMLQLIDLSHNSIIGPIPGTLQQLYAFQTIQNTTTRSLSAQGTLYEEFIINVKGDARHYTYALNVLISLDLSGNQLTGPIPTSFGVLSGLVCLNLSRNNLSGLIPSDLGKLSMLESLDLSYNQLSGSIPSSFYDLSKLEIFNVSYNEGLQGLIPQQPQFEDSNSYINDPDLCGAPTLHTCAGPWLANQLGDKRIEEKASFSSWIDEWVSIPALCLGHLVSFLGTLALIRRWWRH